MHVKHKNKHLHLCGKNTIFFHYLPSSFQSPEAFLQARHFYTCMPFISYLHYQSQYDKFKPWYSTRCCYSQASYTYLPHVWKPLIEPHMQQLYLTRFLSANLTACCNLSKDWVLYYYTISFLWGLLEPSIFLLWSSTTF